MRREFKIVEGFDCRSGHDPAKGNHGRPEIAAREPGRFAAGAACDFGCHGDEWHFAVVEADAATRLIVSTRTLKGMRLSDSVLVLGYPRGGDLTTHVAWPIEEEDVRRGSAGAKCDLLAGGRCFIGHTSALDGDVLWKAYGDPAGGEAQPEAIWGALEAWHAEKVAEARSRRADERWMRCAGCDGRGIVVREGRR